MATDQDDPSELEPAVDAALARRRFLKVTCGALCGALATVIGGPVVVSFLAPDRLRTVTGGGEPIDYGKLADLPVGAPQHRDVVAETRDAWARSDPRVIGSIWLLRHDHGVAAFSAVCPHLGCTVGFDGSKQEFVCPCHDSAFRKDDGAWLHGPAPRGLDPLPLEIKDGRVRVAYRRFVLGIKQRREA